MPSGRTPRRDDERASGALRIVPSKLRPPRVRRELVERSSLLQRLREGRERALTLVCAPAGYGKTTLLAQWEAVDREATPFVWLSLDSRDADPVRFWAHLIEGLRRVLPSVGPRFDEALAAGPGAIDAEVLPLLLQELEDARPLVLVLEDWHTIGGPACDSSVTTLIERAPESLQIVVSSRSDPGLPIAGLRARGALVELRARDLRFSGEEAAALASASGTDLRPDDVELLATRTEGWVAGLYLALLVARDRADRTRFVRDFSGDNRHVLEYLETEVLAATPESIRDFLLRTSVLDRMTAPLCDAVLERTDSAAMLAAIERDNLFLVSLDGSGDTYRYHRLFAAMLRHELGATSGSSVPALHERASRWLEEHDEVEEAIEHAIAAGDLARALSLIVPRAQAFWGSGRITTVARWLDGLSWPEAATDPQLALVRAQVAGMTARGPDEIERWLAVAEAAPDMGPLANGISSLRSGIAILRAVYLSRGLTVAEEEARRALELEPPDSRWRRQCLVSLGQALYLLGRTDEARTPLEEARRLPRAREEAPATALCLAYLALVELEAAATSRAERFARDALSLVEERRLTSGLAAAHPHLALGSVLATGADLRSALEHLERAVELTAPAGATYWHAHALVRLAWAQHRIGDASVAVRTLALARAELEVLPDAGRLPTVWQETSDSLLGRPRREGFLGEDLSEAELRILARLVDGLSIAQIARELYLSQNTVKTHRRSIYRKLGVHTRDELAERASLLAIPGPGGNESHPG